MHLSIAQKIFGIAAVVLVLMVAVAVYSIQLTAGISDDLRSIAARHMPTSKAVGHINVLVLDQGIVLQRLFVLGDDDAFVRDMGAFSGPKHRGRQRVYPNQRNVGAS